MPRPARGGKIRDAMSAELDDLYRRIADELRERLAQAGATWVKAWFVAEAGRDSLAVALAYADRTDGEPKEADPGWDVVDRFKELRELTPHPDLRPWTWARFTVADGGTHAVEFRYPVPGPGAGRPYAPDEIVRAIGACARNALAPVRWADAWVEVGGDHVPFIYYRDTPDGRPEEVRDTEDIAAWLEKLWEARERLGSGGRSACRFHVHRDGRTTADFGA